MKLKTDILALWRERPLLWTLVGAGFFSVASAFGFGFLLPQILLAILILGLDLPLVRQRLPDYLTLSPEWTTALSLSFVVLPDPDLGFLPLLVLLVFLGNGLNHLLGSRLFSFSAIALSALFFTQSWNIAMYQPAFLLKSQMVLGWTMALLILAIARGTALIWVGSVFGSMVCALILAPALNGNSLFFLGPDFAPWPAVVFASYSIELAAGVKLSQSSKIRMVASALALAFALGAISMFLRLKGFFLTPLLALAITDYAARAIWPERYILPKPSPQIA